MKNHRWADLEKLSYRSSARLVLILFLSLALAALGKFAVRGSSAPQTLQQTRTLAGGNATQGEVGIRHLNERRQDKSLQQAPEKARNQADPATGQSGEYLAQNPAQALHPWFTPQGVETHRAIGDANQYAITELYICVSSLTVNSASDGTDATLGDGVCETAAGSGVCTLRAAIQEANAMTACSPITINFSITGTITLSSALPALNHPNLTITGPGATSLTVSGANSFRPFTINTGKTVAITGLTVANGFHASQSGGVENNGTLTMTDCALTSNTSKQGAGIQNNSVLTMTNCAITNNSGPPAGDGGGVISFGTSTTLTNCTISGNQVFGNGGGVSLNAGTLQMTNCTLANNQAKTGGVGGGLNVGVASNNVLLKNTIIIGNTGNGGSNEIFLNNGGTVNGASVNNLIGASGTGGLVNGANGNQVGVATPLLAALGNYGGTTQTIALLPGSPAINAGTSTGAPSSDQRGVARVGATDIGAFESRGFTLAVNGGNNQTAVTGAAFALPLSVTVSSANSEPVDGGNVSFTPPGSGASCMLGSNPATVASGTAASTATANITIGGPYTVSAGATGATAVNFSLTNTNSAPTFTPAIAISRQQGSPASAAVTVGTVADAQTTASSLAITQITGGTATGITVNGIVNTNGTITAVITAGCTATPGTLRFQVSDGSLTGTGDLTVNVTANTAPSVTYGAASVNAGGSTSNSPTSATDNGSITGYVVQSQGTYTGTISVNPTTGVVSISNAAPVGAHTITIRATDNCGATTDATFTLTVGNNLPTITAGAALSRQRGSAGTVSTIATVSDGETAVGSLVVTATTVPAGITVIGITNSAGTISANVAADCTATLGNNTVVLTVTDGNSGTATANLTVTVTANTAPTLTYANVSVNAGGSTSNSPTSATDNGSITSYAVQSQGTYTGTISVNASGLVSISAAAPVGTHTITIRATDNCGSTTDAAFTLTVGNNLPTITAGAALTRQRGSAGTISTIATVSDGETPVGSLVVTVTTVPAGLTVTSITNTAGTITATVAADCTATLGANTVVLTVTDGNSGTATANLTVTVTANTAPSVTYAAASVNAGGSTSNSPTTATDNGSITGYAVQSQGTYTGTISVNASGVVSISAAAPVGKHTITIRVTDNCGSTTDATFALTVGNNLPTITAGAALSRQRGSAGTVSTIATVSDSETPAGSLVVTATTVPAGITVTSITNSAGTITANVTADCTATIGANTVVLTVTDGNGGTATANLTVNVTANTAPSVTYANASVIAGASTSNSPTAATDNGSITGYAVQSQGTYTGTISVNASGVVSISNAMPSGVHTIIIRATDNCGTTTDATFSLTVTNTPPTITAQTGVTRQKGSPASNSQIATVGDAESGTNGVTVTVNGSASATVNGVTISNISNSGGTVTADIVATCGASNASFTLTATDGHAATATATLNVTVTGITLSALVNGLTFVPYSQTLTATGGTGSYTFSLVSGTLPPGLTLNGNLLSGTPTAAGASTFTIRADDDSNACFGERVYTINIGSTGLMYYPLARPVRLLDTRPGASANACFQPNAPITGGTTRTQPARGTCEGLTIPANATTITGHITTVQSGGGSLTLYPSDAPQPNVTNSNYLANEILNNAFTVGLGVNDGAFKLFVGTNTDVVIDVTGYYAPPSASGLYFHPLPKPIRLLETRTGFTGCQATGTPLQTGTTRTQTGVLTCDGVTIPTGALALVGNATTTNSTGSGYLTLWPADATQPFASSSNFAAGVNRNAPFTVGLSLNGEFNIYTARTTDLVIDVMGYYSTQANDANGQGLLFNSLGAPLRLLDTRAGFSACYQPGAPMTGGTVYTQETQIPCTNLTSAARALVGNVSALNASANGYLTFWPSNAVQPTVATSNYQTGRVFNRHFTVGLGTDNAFKRYAASTTDVIIDISGFFAP